MLPPPAPISISSTTGILIGSPLPFLKRCTPRDFELAASDGSPSSIRRLSRSCRPCRTRPACRADRRAVESAPPSTPPRDRIRASCTGTHERHTCSSGAAARQHDVKTSGETLAVQSACEPVEVRAGDRLRICVRRRWSTRARIRGSPVGFRTTKTRRLRKFCWFSSATPVRARINIRMQEAHGDRGGAVAGEARPSGPCATRSSGVRRPRGVDAFGNFPPQLAWNQRWRQIDAEIVDVVTCFGAHLDDVAKSASHDEAGARAFSLDDCVGDERGTRA